MRQRLICRSGRQVRLWILLLETSNPEDWKTLGNGESWWVDLLSGQELGGGGRETSFPLLVTGAWGKDAHGGGGGRGTRAGFVCLCIFSEVKIFH